MGLTLDKATSLHKDFVLNYTTENHHLPSATFGQTDASCTAMLSFIPKFSNLKASDAYVQSLKGTPVEVNIDDAQG